MKHYVVVAQWPSKPCWECEGTTGQAFAIVRAEDGPSAVALAKKRAWRIAPDVYEDARDVWAIELAEQPSPRATVPRILKMDQSLLRAWVTRIDHSVSTAPRRHLMAQSDAEGVPWNIAVARAFHENYEALAPSFGYETRKESAVAWEDVPDQNKMLMVAVVTTLFDDLGNGLLRFYPPQIDGKPGDERAQDGEPTP